MSDFSVLHTKLNPPRLPRHALTRPRVDALLRESLDHRITIVQAGTGYGKSTALANLADANTRVFWYTVGEGDRDPQQFLAHLITAFRLGLPALGDTPLALLQEIGATRTAADALLNALNEQLVEPTLLVIDDYHLAASHDVDGALDYFLAFLPPDLHVILSTRYPPRLEHLVSWRARGQVLEIKGDTLAFTPDEIATLFREKYSVALAPREIALLEEKTEGWPIALQLVWQELRAKPQTEMAALLGLGSDSLDTLFAYLAQNVLSQQPPAVQTFLLETSALRELDASACGAVGSTANCRAMLVHLVERDLFLISLGDEHYRYHHLFHDFLREQAHRQEADAVRGRHRRAAELYRRAENFDEAIYHLLHANAFDETAQLIEEIGEGLLRAGRLDTLASWLDDLPPAVVAAHPLLIFFLGDLARLRSRFDDALAWYEQAERAWRAANDVGGVSRALRGQALVYLDTVRPARAEHLLQESLRLNDGLDDRVARARLLELLAENKLNMGKAEEAEQLRVQARTLREEGPSEDVLSVRVKLRTGQLDPAREILETWAREERGKPHPPRAHRETLLILSLIHALQGRAGDAFKAAEESLSLAAQLNSPFVSAVGQMRLGHAHQIRGDLPAALRCYDEAVALGDQVAVRRTRAEARWGMTRAHGFSGDLEAARRDAAEGIEIGQSAGDTWIVALVQIALGASLVLARRERQAMDPLADALAAFRSCGDTFGSAAARQWLALAHWHLNQRERAMAHLHEALALAQAHHYDYLLTTRTLLGWQDARVAVPLLLEARRRGKHAAYAARLLATMGLENLAAHPGYRLRVRTLGAFRVWRGEIEITAREWQRRKARELLQLFVTHRGKMLEREEIFELLWSRESPTVAARDFKVALNALNKALEPARAADDAPAFIAREDTAYGLRASADVWLDVEEFTALAARAEKENDLDLYRRALALYYDDYLLTDARYAEWAIAERERLLALYLRAADRLADELLVRNQCDEAITWCEHILARDRCWEHAYRLMMRAHAQRGDRAQARRVFEQCTRILREELDVEPSAATVEVYRSV
ncbi:MAG: transcriptional regulator [Chloroflexi bacterium]|nr:transcriptional regulator [Chloroflexota bacterium]